MNITEEEKIFLHNLLGKMDFYLLEHYIDSETKERIDIHSVCVKLYNKLNKDSEE